MMCRCAYTAGVRLWAESKLLRGFQIGYSYLFRPNGLAGDGAEPFLQAQTLYCWREEVQARYITTRRVPMYL